MYPTNVTDSATTPTLQAARTSYQQGAWADATRLYLEADLDTELGIEDLENLVWAAGIAARDEDMLRTLERLYNHHAAVDNHEAVRRQSFSES